MVYFGDGLFWHFCPVCGAYTDDGDAAGICSACLDKADNIAAKDSKGIASEAERAFARSIKKVQREHDKKVRYI